MWTEETVDAPTGNTQVHALPEWLRLALRVSEVPPSAPAPLDSRLPAAVLTDEVWTKNQVALEGKLADARSDRGRALERLAEASRQMPATDPLYTAEGQLFIEREQLRGLKSKELNAKTKLAFARRTEDQAVRADESSRESWLCWSLAIIASCGQMEAYGAAAARKARADIEADFNRLIQEIAARTVRIQQLESDIGRLKAQPVASATTNADALTAAEQQLREAETRIAALEKERAESASTVLANESALRAVSLPTLCRQPLLYRWPREASQTRAPLARVRDQAPLLSGTMNLIVCLNDRRQLTQARAMNERFEDLITSEIQRDRRNRVSEVILRDAHGTELEHHYWIRNERKQVRYTLTFRDEAQGRTISVYTASKARATAAPLSDGAISA